MLNVVSVTKSLTVNDVEDDEDSDTYKANPKKTLKGPSRKTSKKPTVVESSDDGDQISKNNKKPTILSQPEDSDIEEIGNQKESPEEELGEFSITEY